MKEHSDNKSESGDLAATNLMVSRRKEG